MDRQASTTESDLEGMLLDESIEAKALPLSLLNRITDGFSDNQQIGCGGFAVVYKGLLENGAVAVKKLCRTFDIDEEKFSGEIRCLMKAKHKNIVRFLGYCSDTQGQMVKHNGEFVMADVRLRLLCFEYLPNGSLDKYIKDASHEWEKCYQIIKGVCEGLHYLHKERIVHLDLKPANILLDNDMVPKITDFGLSRCFDEKQTHVFTSNLIGTMGYLAPEFYDGKISFKLDIYSLGVIIKEILTAEKGYPVVEDVLESWRHKVEKSREEQQLEQIRVCTEVCKSCLESDPAKRPCTQGIIDILEQTEEQTGASSSTVAPHARPLVENGNKSTGRSTDSMEALKDWERRSADFKEAFKDWSDPKTVARALEAVTQAICLLYAQEDTMMPYEQLNRLGPKLTLHNKGEELHSAMETAMASEVQRLCRSLDDAAPEDNVVFFTELLAKWNQHIKAVRILAFLETKFRLTSSKTSIYELGLRLWRHQIVRSHKIRPRLVEAAMKQERGSKDELVARVNKMTTEVWRHRGGLSFMLQSHSQDNPPAENVSLRPDS